MDFVNGNKFPGNKFSGKKSNDSFVKKLEKAVEEAVEEAKNNTSQLFALGYVIGNHTISNCKIPLELIEKLLWDFFSKTDGCPGDLI